MTTHDDSTTPDLMLKIGVYQIRNLLNGKRYIGSTSTSFQRRWGQHLGSLEKNIHYCAHLQRSWNKYGPDAFAFEILEVVDDPELVIAREQVWIDQYIEDGELYNQSPTAGSTRGYRFSDEAKARIGASRRAYFQTPGALERASEQARRQFSTEKGRANHKRGQERRWANPENHAKASKAQRKLNEDPERKAQFSVRMRRHWASPEHHDRLVAHNRRIASDPELKAKRLASLNATLEDPEVIARMSAAQQRRFSTDEGKVQASMARRPRDAQGNPVRFHLRGPDGTIYRDILNVAAFCRERGLKAGPIRSVLRGETRESQGWTKHREGGTGGD